MSNPSTEQDSDSALGHDSSESTDDRITISRAELQQLQTQWTSGSPVVADGSAGRREAELVRELEARDRKLDELQTAYRAALRDRELASALAGKPLVGGAATQLIKLWRDDFDVYEEAGEFKIAARDGRSTAQWVADRLNGSEYAHFCLPTSRGGVGAKGLSRSSESDGAAASPRTLGEAVISQWRESTASRGTTPQGPAGWGRRR